MLINMETNLIKDRLRSYLKRFYRNHELSDDENIFDLGIVNSLFTMQLITFLEDEFDISLGKDDFAIENFNSIINITTLVDSKLRKEN